MKQQWPRPSPGPRHPLPTSPQPRGSRCASETQGPETCRVSGAHSSPGLFLLFTHSFPHSSAGKESAWNAGDAGSIPGSGRSAREGVGYPPQYWASLVAQLGKNLPTMQVTVFDPCAGKTPWRKEQLPTPVFWPGEFRGRFSPRGREESDTTERLSLSLHFSPIHSSTRGLL